MSFIDRSLVHTERNISYWQHFVLGQMLTVYTDCCRLKTSRCLTTHMTDVSNKVYRLRPRT